MGKKLTSRKHSRLTTEMVKQAYEPVINKRVTVEEITREAAAYRDEQGAKLKDSRSTGNTSAVQAMDTYANANGFPGYENFTPPRRCTDVELERWIRANEFTERERSKPGDLVSAPVFHSALTETRRGEARPPAPENDEIVREAQKRGYYALPDYSRAKSRLIGQLIDDLHLWPIKSGTSDESKRRHVVRVLKKGER
jgi:hypothetical protein